MGNSILSTSIDELMSGLPTGSLDRAILNNLRGINHRQTDTMLPSVRDMPGYLFFTRPQLNLQFDNIRNVRQMSMLLTKETTSIQAYVRAMLDPRIVSGFFMGEDTVVPGTDIPVIDNDLIFIPPLSNNWTSISGWPSSSLPTYRSKAGLYNQSVIIADGRIQNAGAYDLTVNFRNTRGDPILFMFYIWCLYTSMVFEGLLVPYLDFITEVELDYMTRIYHIETDYTKRTVTKLVSNHACIPVGLPTGDSFNVSKNQPFVEANKEISITFSCLGVDYFDPITVIEFNKAVCIGCPDMADDVRETSMIKLGPALVDTMNHKGYPRIDPNTAELEWWLKPRDYQTSVTNYLKNVQATADQNQVFEGD